MLVGTTRGQRRETWHTIALTSPDHQTAEDVRTMELWEKLLAIAVIGAAVVAFVMHIATLAAS